MVVSRIDKSIEYPPVKFIDSEDMDYDAQLYELELFPSLEVIIALGNVKYTYIDKKVLYIPVYLTNDGEVLMQIGVYEFPAYLYTSLLDDDNDFDISLLENPLPLLYKFVTEPLIRKETQQKKITTSSTKKVSPVTATTTETLKIEDITDSVSSKTKTGDSDADALYEDSRVPNTETILEMIEDDDKSPVISDKMVAEETEQNINFKAHGGHNWLEKYMRNDKYGIIDNEGDGDCLFATIRDAFSGIKKNISVDDLRKIVSEAATQQSFLNFKEQYNMYFTEVQSLGEELVNLKKKVDELKLQARTVKDREAKKKIVEDAKPFIAQFRRKKKKKKKTSLL